MAQASAPDHPGDLSAVVADQAGGTTVGGVSSVDGGGGDGGDDDDARSYCFGTRHLKLQQ